MALPLANYYTSAAPLSKGPSLQTQIPAHSLSWTLPELLYLEAHEAFETTHSWASNPNYSWGSP